MFSKTMYGPKAGALDGRWNPPSVKRIWRRRRIGEVQPIKKGEKV